jgi:hypothetical protein
MDLFHVILQQASCILCRDPDHLPLRCEEVEKVCGILLTCSLHFQNMLLFVYVCFFSFRGIGLCSLNCITMLKCYYYSLTCKSYLGLWHLSMWRFLRKQRHLIEGVLKRWDNNWPCCWIAHCTALSVAAILSVSKAKAEIADVVLQLMTKALIRECTKCRTELVKSDGCNKVRICGYHCICSTSVSNSVFLSNLYWPCKVVIFRWGADVVSICAMFAGSQ